MRIPFTKGEIKFIIDNYDKLNNLELAKKLNDYFGTNRSAKSVQVKRIRLGFTKNNHYSKAEYEYILENIDKLKCKEIHLGLQNISDIHRTRDSVAAYIQDLRRKIRTGKITIPEKTLLDNNKETPKVEVPEIRPRELIYGMTFADYNIKTLSRDTRIPIGALTEMVTKTGVPSRYAGKIKSVLGL